MYQVSVSALPNTCAGVYRWCLDFPKDSQSYEEAFLLERGLKFQGWVLANPGVELRPYFSFGETVVYFTLDVARRDVIERVLNVESSGHEQLECGFRAEIRMSADVGTFGIEVSGSKTDLIKIEIFGSLRIIQGLEGWLFLDNDSNQSVDQYKGNLLLDKQALRQWSDYLDALRANGRANTYRYALLIAPAKEMVLPEYYPHQKGETSPVEQVLALARPEHHVVHPVRELRACPARPFRMCDTHWTSKGAMYALLAVLRELGVDPAEAGALFESDAYKETDNVGDLGSKVFPKRSSKELVLTGAHYRKWVEYDNFLPNMGRVLIIRNPNALYTAKCVIFGSSSTYSLFDYVSRVFSEVLFIHSAGSIDYSVVGDENPDYLIAQTNGRFVIRPPDTGYSLPNEILDKWQRLDDGSRQEILGKQAKWVVGDQSSIRFHKMLPIAE